MIKEIIQAAEQDDWKDVLKHTAFGGGKAVATTVFGVPYLAIAGSEVTKRMSDGEHFNARDALTLGTASLKDVASVVPLPTRVESTQPQQIAA